jgi:hypothetical protein
MYSLRWLVPKEFDNHWRLADVSKDFRLYHIHHHSSNRQGIDSYWWHARTRTAQVYGKFAGARRARPTTPAVPSSNSTFKPSKRPTVNRRANWKINQPSFEIRRHCSFWKGDEEVDCTPTASHCLVSIIYVMEWRRPPSHIPRQSNKSRHTITASGKRITGIVVLLRRPLLFSWCYYY